MDLLWYGNWGRPLLAFPTSLGSCSQNEDCGLIGGLQGKIESGQIQVCCVDPIDGEAWYNSGAHPGYKAHRYAQFEQYLESEVVPLIRSKSERSDIMTFGASFGAYHAMNFSFRHPELISRVISFSGLYDIHGFLDGYWDDTCYFNCPTAYIPNLPPEWIERLKQTGIVIATGQHDHLARENREFAALLQEKGLKVHAEWWPGVFGHDWPFWTEHLPRFVP